MRENAGKTGVIAGLASNIGKSFGYLKPFGDRVCYRDKKIWDYDAEVIDAIFGLKESPVDMSIGFDHSKLRYMFDEKSTSETLLKMKERVSAGRDVLFVESGRDAIYGTSVHLDAISLARSLDARLVIVISGDEDTILDDIMFAKAHLQTPEKNFAGVIINKVQSLEEFNRACLDKITEMGVKVLGVLPHTPALGHFTVDFLHNHLRSRLVTGAASLGEKIQTILIGAMSYNELMGRPALQEKDILWITSGDRSDIILAALEASTSCIVLTNSVLPPPNIISKVQERGVPLLMVRTDTFQTAKRIDDMVPLLSAGDSEKVALLKKLAAEHLKLDEIIKG
jgi:dethiobiotin synthetase